MLTFENDIEPYSVERDAFVMKLAKEHEVNIVQEYSHTIFAPELVLKKNGGLPPMTYQKFISVASSLTVPSPVAKPSEVPSFCNPEKDKHEVKDEDC